MPALIDAFVKETAARVLAAATWDAEDASQADSLQRDLESAIAGAFASSSLPQTTRTAPGPGRWTPDAAASPANGAQPSQAPQAQGRGPRQLAEDARGTFAFPSPREDLQKPKRAPSERRLRARGETRRPTRRTKTADKPLDLFSREEALRPLEPPPLPAPEPEAQEAPALEAPVEVIKEVPGAPVPIYQSVTPNHLVCLEDGEKVENLRQHLKKAHSMTPEDYRAKWGLPEGYPMMAPNFRRVGPKIKDWLRHDGEKVRGKASGRPENR